MMLLELLKLLFKLFKFLGPNRMNCNVEEISIGDEVIFESTNSQSNHDLYWIVIGKNERQLKIRLNEMGYDEYWTIDIKEVIAHIPLNKPL